MCYQYFFSKLLFHKLLAFIQNIARYVTAIVSVCVCMYNCVLCPVVEEAYRGCEITALDVSFLNAYYAFIVMLVRFWRWAPLSSLARSLYLSPIILSDCRLCSGCLYRSICMCAQSIVTFWPSLWALETTKFQHRTFVTLSIGHFCLDIERVSTGGKDGRSHCTCVMHVWVMCMSIFHVFAVCKRAFAPNGSIYALCECSCLLQGSVREWGNTQVVCAVRFYASLLFLFDCWSICCREGVTTNNPCVCLVFCFMGSWSRIHWILSHLWWTIDIAVRYRHISVPSHSLSFFFFSAIYILFFWLRIKHRCISSFAFVVLIFSGWKLSWQVIFVFFSAFALGYDSTR